METNRNDVKTASTIINNITNTAMETFLHFSKMACNGHEKLRLASTIKVFNKLLLSKILHSDQYGQNKVPMSSDRPNLSFLLVSTSFLFHLITCSFFEFFSYLRIKDKPQYPVENSG